MQLSDARLDSLHSLEGSVERTHPGGCVGRQQRFGDEVVLAAAEGAEGDVALDDLAGAGVADGGAVAPAAGVAVDPLDDVVADVHGVGAGGEDVDLEGSGSPAGGLECLVPPARAFDERGADGLGGSAVDVVLDGSDGDARPGAVWVALDEAVADDELLCQRLAERCVVVAIAFGEVTGARRVAARREAGVGKGDEALVLMDGHRAGIGGDVTHVASTSRASTVSGDAAGRAVGTAFAGEGELRFQFGVLRECLYAVERDGGARGVEAIRAATGAGNRFGHAVRVADDEVGGVDQDGGAVGRLRFDVEAGHDGTREGCRHDALLVGVRRTGAEGGVGLDEQQLGAGALEAHDALAAELAAVEAEIVGACAPGQRGDVEEILRAGVRGVRVERDFEVQLAGFGVPVDGDQAGRVGHRSSARGEGLRRLGGCIFVLREKRGGAGGEGKDELSCAHELL